MSTSESRAGRELARAEKVQLLEKKKKALMDKEESMKQQSRTVDTCRTLMRKHIKVEDRDPRSAIAQSCCMVYGREVARQDDLRKGIKHLKADIKVIEDSLTVSLRLDSKRQNGPNGPVRVPDPASLLETANRKEILIRQRISDLLERNMQYAGDENAVPPGLQTPAALSRGSSRRMC